MESVLPTFSPTASWMPFANMNGGIQAIEKLIKVFYSRNVTLEYRPDKLQSLRAQLEAQEAQAHQAMEQANEVRPPLIKKSKPQAHTPTGLHRARARKASGPKSLAASPSRDRDPPSLALKPASRPRRQQARSRGTNRLAASPDQPASSRQSRGPDSAGQPESGPRDEQEGARAAPHLGQDARGPRPAHHARVARLDHHDHVGGQVLLRGGAV